MVERELPKLNTRVRFPSPAFARSFLAGYSAAQHRFRPLVPRGLQRGAARNSPRTYRRLKPKGRKRRAVSPASGRTKADQPNQRCTTSTFLNPLLSPVISTLAPPTICGSACASIRPTSILMRPSTVLGSSKPTWHLRRKRPLSASRVISNPARVGHFVSVTSTSRSSLSQQPPLLPALAYYARFFLDSIGAKSVLLY
jgi:hypothetical protein